MRGAANQGATLGISFPPSVAFMSKTIGSENESARMFVQTVEAAEGRLTRRFRRISWEFLLSQLLMICVAVTSVYIAAQEGLRQAVKFDRYQSAQRQLNGLSTIQRELEINRSRLQENLRLLRGLTIVLSEAESVKIRNEVTEREQALIRAQRAFDEAEDRDRESRRRPVELAERALAISLEKSADIDARLNAYRAFFPAGLPDSARQTDKGEEIKFVDYEPIERMIWNNLSQQDFLYQFDADLIAHVARFYSDAEAMEKPLVGQQNWDPYQPRRVALAGHATRREAHQIELLERLETEVLPRVAKTRAERQQVVDAYVE